MSICIIPARGGSKRLPRKNILPYRGSPLLSHTIKTAIASDVFEDIIVSSDDDEILQIAEGSGATPIRRDQYLATDRSTVVEVCLDVLKRSPADVFCCIYPTAVLLTTSSIKKSAMLFNSPGYSQTSVLMGVSQYNYHPVQALSVDENSNAKLLFPTFKDKQSQLYPTTRVSNGTLYWARKNSFESEKTFYSSALKVFEVPATEVCDIDTADDYERLTKTN